MTDHFQRSRKKLEPRPCEGACCLSDHCERCHHSNSTRSGCWGSPLQCSGRHGGMCLVGFFPLETYSLVGLSAYSVGLPSNIVMQPVLALLSIPICKSFDTFRDSISWCTWSGLALKSGMFKPFFCLCVRLLAKSY